MNINFQIINVNKFKQLSGFEKKSSVWKLYGREWIARIAFICNNTITVFLGHCGASYHENNSKGIFKVSDSKNLFNLQISISAYLDILQHMYPICSLKLNLSSKDIPKNFIKSVCDVVLEPNCSGDIEMDFRYENTIKLLLI